MTRMDLLQLLKPREQRGSKPRCHLYTSGPDNEVAMRLETLARPFANVSSSDHWMPQGFVDLTEAQLHQAPRLLDPVKGDSLKAWWLAKVHANSRTPNIDIASTCTIGGKAGLLLVEAKAHHRELSNETIGKRLAAGASGDSISNHERIGVAIEEARAGLEQATALPWGLSRDTHYQISNRFAWAWKLAQLGVPTVVVYLGFLHADDMASESKPFTSAEEWETAVRSHAHGIVPDEVWGRCWPCGSACLIPLVGAVSQVL